MKRLDAEQYRVLAKRIASAVENARYYPGTATDPSKVANDVLRPYAPVPPRTDSK